MRAWAGCDTATKTRKEKLRIMTRMNQDASSLFVRDGDGYRPTRLSGGPWSPDALHGGPPSALLARAIESFEGGEERFVARMTVELLRPVPFERLTLSTRLSRPGRKVQLVEATLSDGTKDVARATGLRLARGKVELPDDLPLPTRPAIAGPHEITTQKSSSPAAFLPGFHSEAVEHRFVEGAFDEPGPALDWVRLKVPLLENEPLSPLCRVCAIADFGNGVSGVFRGTHTYINPDLTVYLHRYPVTEWVCLDAATVAQPHGVGLAESLLRDERGPIGRSLQSLIIEAR